MNRTKKSSLRESLTNFFQSKNIDPTFLKLMKAGNKIDEEEKPVKVISKIYFLFGNLYLEV